MNLFDNQGETAPSSLVIISLLALVAVSGVVLLSGAVVADTGTQDGVVSVDYETTYDGLENSQEIIVEVALVTEEPVSGLEVDISESNQAFIDDESFETTTPDGVSVERTGDVTYEIEELDEGDEVELTFGAYPRYLGEESLNIGQADLSAENPQTLDQQANFDIELDAESSPVFAYQDARSDQTIVDRIIGAISAMTIGAFLLGLVGVGAASYYRFYGVSKAVEEKEDEFVKSLKDMKVDMPRTECQQRVDQEIDDWEGPGISLDDFDP